MTDPDPRPSDHAPPEELAAYVRTNLLRALAGIALLSVVLVIVGAMFEAQLIGLAESVYESLGMTGLAAVLFVTDAIFSPMPPDVILVVVANSSLHEHWPLVLPCVGVLSAFAGNTGWFIGSYFARISWAAPFVSRVRMRYEGPIRRFDRWAVMLGAITPLPFSLVCISAGALGMRWKRLAPLTLLRIPRFGVFYWVVYYSTAGCSTAGWAREASWPASLASPPLSEPRPALASGAVEPASDGRGSGTPAAGLGIGSLLQTSLERSSGVSGPSYATAQTLVFLPGSSTSAPHGFDSARSIHA